MILLTVNHVEHGMSQCKNDYTQSCRKYMHQSLYTVATCTSLLTLSSIVWCITLFISMIWLALNYNILYVSVLNSVVYISSVISWLTLNFVVCMIMKLMMLNPVVC